MPGSQRTLSSSNDHSTCRPCAVKRTRKREDPRERLCLTSNRSGLSFPPFRPEALSPFTFHFDDPREYTLSRTAG